MKVEKLKNKSFSFLALLTVSALVLTPFLLVNTALAAPVDSTVPQVVITAPVNGANVSGVVIVSATASDAYSSCVITVFGQQYDISSLQSDHSGGNVFTCNTDMTAVYQGQHGSNVSRIASFLIPASYVGVEKVELYVDGNLATTDLLAPYSFSWNTASITNGLHTLTVKAYDQAGNIGTSATVTVTVSGAVTPVLTSISLTPTSTTLGASGTQQLTATALDQLGVALSPQPVVVWSSSNTSTATVSQTGLVTAVATGTAMISVSSGTVSTTATVTVNTQPSVEPPTGVSGRIIAEINVGDGKTEVKAKINGVESEFKLNTADTNEVINLIVQRTGLSRETVLAVTVLKIDGQSGGGGHEEENEQEDEHEDMNNNENEHEDEEDNEDDKDEHENRNQDRKDRENHEQEDSDD